MVDNDKDDDDDDDDDRLTEVEDDDESMNMPMMMLLSCMVMRSPSPIPWWSMGSIDDESLVFGDIVEEDDEVLSLFFIVEFQKFFISLSVRPGKHAAIWDHLYIKIKLR